MFLGHIGVGLLAKKPAPKVPVGILAAVALAPDILSIPGIIVGTSKIDLVPWTHGVLMMVVCAVVVFLISMIISKNVRTSMVLGLLIIAHGILDFIAWPMDFGRGLPLLLNGSPEIGLGLYRTAVGSIIGEGAGLIFVGIMIYLIKSGRFFKQTKQDT